MESRRHPWNCPAYVDLNMMRAGAVSHPADCDWWGCREMAGRRGRYRLLDSGRLAENLDARDIEDVREACCALIESGWRAGGWQENPAGATRWQWAAMGGACGNLLRQC